MANIRTHLSTLPLRSFRYVSSPPNHWRSALAFLLLATSFQAASAQTRAAPRSLEEILQTSDLIVLADVKHGTRDRIAFFSSAFLFETMKRAGVRHIAIEMPRVLGRQAMAIDTEDDVEAFAQDIVRSDHWHFTDPDHPAEESSVTQYRVAFALGQQVLLAKRLGINPIFYDFNNPLGGFNTLNDPVYRCLAELSQMAWLKSGLDGKVTKAQRDAAIMRERLSHDDELAAYIEREVNASGGGKVVVVPGYAHAVIPGGIADRIGNRLHTQAATVAVFANEAEDKAFHALLWEQSRILAIDLSRPPQFYYTISNSSLREDTAPGRYAALDGSRERNTPAICYQFAHSN